MGKECDVLVCRDCVWFEEFVSRLDEPSAFGCRCDGIEGYVIDPDFV